MISEYFQKSIDIFLKVYKNKKLLWRNADECADFHIKHEYRFFRTILIFKAGFKQLIPERKGEK